MKHEHRHNKKQGEQPTHAQHKQDNTTCDTTKPTIYVTLQHYKHTQRNTRKQTTHNTTMVKHKTQQTQTHNRHI